MTETKIRVVGIGSAGIRMAEAVEALKLPNVQTVAVDIDLERVKEAAAAKKLPMFMEQTAGRGTGGNTKTAKEAAVKYVKYLAQIARRTKVLVLLGGLGGGTASIIAPVILRLVQEPTVAVSIFAVPFELEGASKVSIAKKSFEFIREKSTAAIALENDKMLADAALGAREAVEKANAKVAAAVEILSAGFSRSAFLPVDAGAFKSTFAGKRAYAGCAAADAQDIDSAFAAVKKSPMMNCNMQSQDIFAIIKCPVKMSMDSIKDILKKARENFKVADKIHFSVSPDADGKNVKILVLATEKSEDFALPEVSLAPIPQAETAANSAPAAQHQPADSIKDEPPQAAIPAGEEVKKDEEIPEEPAPVREDELPEDIARQTPQQTLVPETEIPVVAEAQTAPVEAKAPEAKDKKKQPPKEQMTFKLDERGLFENTPRYERKGVDLDIPTFTRHKIKITLL